MNVEKEFPIMQNYMKRYKRKPLVFECGCFNAPVSRIEKYGSSIFIYTAMSDTAEKILAIFDSNTKKGRDYKYLRKYHILEVYE